jgi:hypothetical protein
MPVAQFHHMPAFQLILKIYAADAKLHSVLPKPMQSSTFIYIA